MRLSVVTIIPLQILYFERRKSNKNNGVLGRKRKKKEKNTGRTEAKDAIENVEVGRGGEGRRNEYTEKEIPAKDKKYTDIKEMKNNEERK